MKRTLPILYIVLILALVLSVVVSGCSSGTTTTTTTSKSTTTTTTTSKSTTTTTTSPTTTTTTTTSPTTTTTTSAGPSVYVSVSVDGKLLVAAQPIVYTQDMTVEAVIKAAHEAYYADGLNGYQADESQFGAGYYIINKCWGVKNIPCIIINEHPNSELVFQAVNAVKVKANDNIIISTVNSGGTNTPVSLKAVVSDGKVTITAKIWTMNPANYTWVSKLHANAKVVDSKGATLGTTDADGKITLTIPADGIVAIDGLAAINVNASAT
jgi:hypothetical protein